MGGLGDQNARLYDRVQHSFVSSSNSNLEQERGRSDHGSSAMLLPVHSTDRTKLASHSGESRLFRLLIHCLPQLGEIHSIT